MTPAQFAGLAVTHALELGMELTRVSLERGHVLVYVRREGAHGVRALGWQFSASRRSSNGANGS